MRANAVSNGKANEKASSVKKNRRRSVNLAKAGVRQKRSHSSRNGLGCNRNSMDGDSTKKGRGSVKINVMRLTCSVSEDRLKKVGQQIGVVWNDIEVPKISNYFYKYQGFRGGGKKGWVMSIIRGEKPDVIALQETKSGLVDDFLVEEVWGNRTFGFTQMEAKGRSGRMLIIWDTNVFNCFDAMGDDIFIAIKGGWKGGLGDVVLVCLYGLHITKEKTSLWDRLARLMSNSSEDWCIFGDFNVVRRQEDRLNSQINVKEMEDFNNFINITRLVEIPLGG
ncbi:RNA-directed DNA polymerase, eukaryota [Tanacetum coccineum]